MDIKTKANLYLLLVAIIWGATFPVIKNAITDIPPDVFVFIRFSIAGILFLPIAIKKYRSHSYGLITTGIILGVFNSGCYVLQTQGLQFIDASRSAFITGVSVVMVSILAMTARLAKFNWADIIATVVCLFGLYILTGANIHNIGYGDILTLGCALSVALAIVFLQWVSKFRFDYGLLSFYQIIFTVPIPLYFGFSQFRTSQLAHLNVAVAIIFCAIFATVLCLFLQTKYQKYTTATKAALIYSLEPVFACIFGYFLNGSNLTHATILGGAIMLVSLLLPDMLKRF